MHRRYQGTLTNVWTPEGDRALVENPGAGQNQPEGNSLTAYAHHQCQQH